MIFFVRSVSFAFASEIGIVFFSTANKLNINGTAYLLNVIMDAVFFIPFILPHIVYILVHYCLSVVPEIGSNAVRWWYCFSHSMWIHFLQFHNIVVIFSFYHRMDFMHVPLFQSKII